MSNIKVNVTLASMILVAVVLALSVGYHGGIVSEARAAVQDAQSCSVRTLRGAYGRSFQFLNTTPGNAGQPINFGTHTPGAGIAVTTFDGRGNFFTQAGTISIGGLIYRGITASGPYTVNANCMGSRVLNNLPDGSTVRLDFVIVDGGKEVHELSIGQGEVTVSVLKKQ